MTAAPSLHVDRPAVEFNDHQQAAIDAARAWLAGWYLRRHRRQYLTLGGLAGTGKSTIAAHLAALWPFAAVASYTGKAAAVLRKKGVDRAQTLHSLLYVRVPGPGGKPLYEWIQIRQIMEAPASHAE